MSKEIESISSALFDKIRSRFSNITLGDESAKAVTDPTKARFFNFAYVDNQGNEFGKVTLSLIDEVGLKIYFGQNISSGMDREQRQEWYEFLRNLRQFARRNLLTFDTRDINKSNLDIQDVKQQAKTDDVATVADVAVTESRLYGTSRNSYADMGGCRLLIKHDGLVSDDKHGDRARRIREIFIETEKGERFLVPHTNLDGARAMAQHINHGGSMHDEYGQHIDELVKEMAAMRHFVRSVKHRQFEDQETADMTKAAVHHYDETKRKLRSMRGARSYRSYFETFAGNTDVEKDVDIDALRERFVKKVYDDRFNDALPYVYRAYQQQKESAAANFGDELEEWADEVYEDTWNESSKNHATELAELFKTPVPVGIDGMDAQSKFKPFIDDEELNKAFYVLSQSPGGQGPDADARPLVKNWLQQNDVELLAQLQLTSNNAAETNYQAPVSPEVTTSDHGADVTHPNVSNMTMESGDPLDFIKSLAGLNK